MEGLVTQLSELTGLPSEQAQVFLEMAAGDLELAMSLYFDQGDPGAAAHVLVPATSVTSIEANSPEWMSLVWSKGSSVPDAWRVQGLDFTQGLQLPQHKNGPCGVLAAVQATVIAQYWRVDGFGPSFEVTPTVLAEALASILTRVIPNESSSKTIKIVSLDDVNTVHSFEAEKAANEMEKHVDVFTKPGGAVSLVYSIGVDLIKKELSAEHAQETSLIAGPFALCTSELLSLLLIGVPRGNVSAYSPEGTDPNVDEQVASSAVGLLSFEEVETGIPLANAFKNPTAPVWILHGGDHFTVLFGRTMPPTEMSTFTLYHYNGLPPAGPRMAELEVFAPKGAAKKAPEKQQPTYYKPEPGEIEDVVQAHPDDKRERPGKRYELVLAVEDNSVEGAPRPPDMPAEPKFALGNPPRGPWRCASCYRTRFQTMVFGQNEAGNVQCQHCGKDRLQCGWTLWLEYASLPQKIQRLVMKNYAPKVANLLQTKWPQCSLTYLDRDEPPSV